MSEKNHVLLYTSAICPYCVAAKNFLKSKGLDYAEIRVDTKPGAMEEMMQRTGRRSVPQIFINNQHLGGYDDMIALDRAGKFQPLLNT